MFLKALGKLAATTLLGAALAGCIDADVDVELLSATTARATITQVMGADFYAMIKMNAEGSKGQSEPEEFCATGALTENSDGTATPATPFATHRLRGSATSRSQQQSATKLAAEKI